jgi:hypothetical protein
MEWNPQKVLANIRQADTDDLLDRVTAYRQGMEPEAVEMIEAELHRRGIGAAAIEKRRQSYERECLFYPDGTAMMCSFCRLPAVAQEWGWHKLRNMVPLFPRRFRYCKSHQPATSAPAHPPPPA